MHAVVACLEDHFKISWGKQIINDLSQRGFIRIHFSRDNSGLILPETAAVHLQAVMDR